MVLNENKTVTVSENVSWDIFNEFCQLMYMEWLRKTYKLIWWNSSCNCNSISAMSDSVAGEMDPDPEELTLPWRQVLRGWDALEHSAMLWFFIKENTFCTFAPTEWLGPVFWKKSNNILFGLCQAKKCLGTGTKCTDSDHPAQNGIFLVDREGPDQTVSMHRLI